MARNKTDSQKVGYIYFIINTVSRKWYVGSTVNLNRQMAHKRNLRRGSHCNFHLQNSWNRYGEDSFEFSQLIPFKSEVEARGFEQSILNEHCGKGHCFNLDKNAHRNHTIQYNDDVKKRMSDKAFERMKQPELRKKISDSVKDLYKNPEYQRKITKKVKESLEDPNVRYRIGSAMRGKKHTKKWKDANSKLHTGRKRSEETKRKMREAWIKRKLVSSN